jgi:hypothetical protein
MTTDDASRHSIGANKPPIVPPSEQDFLDDLKRRFPEIDTKIAEFEAALKDYPKTFTLADEPVAMALQDLLGQIKKQKTIVAAHKKAEKAPWSGVVNIVMNFFETRSDKLERWEAEWKPIHQQFLDLRDADIRRKAEEQAEKERAEAERLRKEQAEAEDRIRKAEEEAAEARKREAEAREREAQAERDREAAEERARLAKAEEKRLADEKRERDNAEKAQNADGIKAIKDRMKIAERLHELGEADEANPSEIEMLDELIRPGGIIGAIAAPIITSILLDDGQKTHLDTVRERLGELRKAMNDRFDAKERRRREAERKRHEEEEAKQKAAKDVARAQEEREAAERRQAREKAEADAEAAKAAQKAAKTDVREARADQRGASAEQKSAGSDARRLSTDADRTENRADRLERKAGSDESTGPARGELGTKGSLTGRWVRYIQDEAALRAACGPLGEHFTTSALEGATHQYMVAYRSGWAGERYETPELPGVLFVWERDTRIT